MILRLLSCIILVSCNLQGISPLAQKTFYACVPSVVFESYNKPKTAVTPYNKNPLFDLLLKAQCRDTNPALLVTLACNAVLQNRNTQLAYRCITEYEARTGTLPDPKTMDEIQQAKDQNNKSMLHHAIDREDQAWVHALVHKASEQKQRDELALTAFDYATQNNKPRALIAILPSARAITNAFEKLPNASSIQIKTYFEALDILKKNKHHKASLYKKAISNSTIAAKLPPELQDEIREILHSHNAFNSNLMHPALEQAIIANDGMRLIDAIISACDLKLLNGQGMNAMELAAYHGKHTLLKLMVNNSPYTPKEQIKRLEEIARAQSKNTKTKVRVDALAATIEYIETIPAYIAKITDELSQNISLNPNTSTVLKALNRGANPNARALFSNPAYPFLYWTTLMGKSELTQLLLKYGADQNLRPKSRLENGSILFWAMIFETLDTFRTLLDHGANANDYARDGNPLTLFALSYPVEYLKLLLERGADPNSTATNGRQEAASLLKEAIDDNKPEHFEVLLNHGARLNASDPLLPNESFWIYNRALRNSNPKFLKLLLQHQQVDPSTMIDSRGKTLSLLAEMIYSGHTESALILLEHGANPNTPHRYGYQSLLRYVENNRNIENRARLWDALKKHGAQHALHERYPELIEVPFSIGGFLVCYKICDIPITFSGIALSCATSTLVSRFFLYCMLRAWRVNT